MLSSCRMEAVVKSSLTGIARGLALVCAASMVMVGCDTTREEVPLSAAPPMPMPPMAGAPAVPATTTVGTEIDDSVVTGRVMAALLSGYNVKSSQIKVETRKGVVLLSGFVDDQTRINRALALVAKVEGVKGVENGMTLKEGTQTAGNALDDSIVTTKVRSALLADSLASSFDVAVVTRKGKVQLSGYVDNQAGIDRAVAIALAVEGVHSVDNEMSIKK